MSEILKTHVAFAVFSLVLFALLITPPYSSAWADVTFRPTQAAFQGVFSWTPNPMIAGGTASFGIEIKNLGSVAFRVTIVQLKTDWSVAYNVSDVPQDIDEGRSYKFAYLSIPIPSSAVGSHTFHATFWWQLPPLCGSGESESQQNLGDVTVDIESGPAITGPTTMVMGALGKPTQQPFDWGDFLLVALVLIIMIEIVVLLLFQLRNRREKQ